MQHLKDTICHSTALHWLDYMSRNEVILAVDTSYIAVRFILLQIRNDRKHYPNRFSSVSLMEVESHYSQAKLKLYGLFHTLQAVHIFIFGIANLTVEMDAKYVKGMINNPDLQPNVTINRWIMGILLFHFHPEHVPTTHHTGPDGLSWWLPSENNPVEEDDFEDWIDNAYSFMISLMNMRTSPAVGTTDHHRHTTHTSEMPSHNLSVLISATLDTSQTNPTIPHSHKAVAKESCIDNIHDFLDTHIHPTDLSDADYKSFINAATRFFILNNALYHWKPHGCHQLVILIAHRYRLIWEAHDSLGHKGVFSVCYTSVTDDRGKRAKSPSK